MSLGKKRRVYKSDRYLLETKEPKIHGGDHGSLFLHVWSPIFASLGTSAAFSSIGSVAFSTFLHTAGTVTIPLPWVNLSPVSRNQQRDPGPNQHSQGVRSRSTHPARCSLNLFVHTTLSTHSFWLWGRILCSTSVHILQNSSRCESGMFWLNLQFLC